MRLCHFVPGKSLFVFFLFCSFVTSRVSFLARVCLCFCCLLLFFCGEGAEKNTVCCKLSVVKVIKLSHYYGITKYKAPRGFAWDSEMVQLKLRVAPKAVLALQIAADEPSEGHVMLSATTLSGETVASLRLSLDAEVAELVHALAQRSGTPERQLRLVFASGALADASSGSRKLATLLGEKSEANQ